MATASDDFERADETPLAGNWTQYGGGGTSNRFNLSGGVVVAPNSTTDDCNATWNQTSFGADQFSEAKLTVTGGGGNGQGVGLVVRSDSAAQAPAGADKHSHYRVTLDHAATNNVQLQCFNAGTPRTLQTVTQAWTNGDTIRLEITGYVLSVKINGAAAFTTFDDSASGSKLASGQPGISNSTNDTSPSFNDWAGGDLGGAAPQQLRPDADTDADSWITAPLWSKIDEASAGGDVISGTAI